MLVYIGTYLLLFMVGFVDTINRNRKNILFFLLVLLLICHDGLRWETGTDWEDYYNAFDRCLIYLLEDFEVGYVTMMQTIRSFTDEYTVFLLIHATIVYSLMAIFLWKYSPIPTLSLFFLYGFMLPLLGMNRQYLSLAICLISVYFIFKRKLLMFLLYIGVACLFHKSALLFIPAYFFTKEYSLTTYLVWIAVAIIISFSGIVKMLPEEYVMLLFPKEYSSYVNVVDISIFSKTLGMVRKLIWVILAIYLLKREIRPQGFSLFFNLYFVSVIGYLLLNGTLFQIIVARGLIYYSLFEVLVLTYIVAFISNQSNKKAYLCLIALYYAIVLYKNITFYTEGDYNCFIPYQFCF